MNENNYKKSNRESKNIVISDKMPGLPYSKGIMASSMMATGLAPDIAYKVAGDIESYLKQNEIFSLTVKRLRNITYRTLKERVGDEVAERYLRWQSLGRLGKPLIILIGGATGVGKSTIGAQLANRLNITRLVSTDIIREVMRASISEKLIRPLRGSSYNAGQNLSYPLPGGDPVVLGFREQTLAVVVGVQAVMRRAVDECTHIIIEGAHICPGYIDVSNLVNGAVVMQVVITVDNLQLHKDHFLIRDIETRGSRPFLKYIQNIDNIRKIQDYIVSLAQEHGVKIVNSYNLDLTLNEILDYMNEVLIREFEVPAEQKAASQIPLRV